MAERQFYTYLEHFVFRKDCSFLEAQDKRFNSIKIKLDMSLLESTIPRLDSSDFEVGDKLCIEVDPLSKVSSFSHKFSSVEVRKDSTNLYILTSGYDPSVIPLSIISSFSARIPDQGQIKVFQRDEKICILKVGINIFRLGRSEPLPLKVKNLYITDINGTKILASENLNYIGLLENIQLSSLKSYNQPWRVSDLAKGDMIKAKYDTQNRPLSYKLALSPTEVNTNVNRYYFTIREHGIKEMSREQLGEAIYYIKHGMVGLKVLHTRGEIRALLHRKEIIRLPRVQPIRNFDLNSDPFQPYTNLNSSLFPFSPYIIDGKVRNPNVPEVQKASYLSNEQAPESIKPNYIQNIQELNQQYSREQTLLSTYSVQHLKQDRTSSVSSSSSDGSMGLSSVSDSSDTVRANTEINQSFSLTEANKRIHIKDIRINFTMPNIRFNEISSVFRHGRVFMNDKVAYLKAIGVGYLDQLCRKSTHPSILKQFITNLESRSGLYLPRIQSEQSRNLLINFLKILEQDRSIDSTEEYYINPDFMEVYISEIKNLTYNQMVLENANSDLMKLFSTSDTVMPKEVLRYIGKALGVLIFTMSLRDSTPKLSRYEDYSFVMNLILRGQYTGCLLYYNYQNGEDRRVPFNAEKFACNNCRLLPHITYFSKINAKFCQKCHQTQDRIPQSNMKGQPLQLPDNPSKKANKYKKGQNDTNLNQINSTTPPVVAPSKPSEPLIPSYPCDGCNDSMSLNKLKAYCNAQHILCEKCSIISSRKKLCVRCDLIRAQIPSNFPGQPIPMYANRNPRDNRNIQTKSCSQCNREIHFNLLQNLKCRHSYCRDCLSNHINQLILNTPMSIHIEAGVVNLTCPEPTCRKLISGKIFFNLMAPDTKNVYDRIISLLPKDPCNKCQKHTIRPYLTNLGCHKFCRKCIVEYFDSKLNQRQINFGCAVGCYHKFSLQDLRKIMKPYQFSKFQEIETGGGSKPEVSKCPGCPKEYYSISHHCSFLCKKCNTTFCGSCRKITSIQGNYIQGMHDSSCRFYKPF